MIQELTTLYQSVPVSTWHLIGVAITLSGIMQIAKHFLFTKLGEKAIMTITTALAFGASVLQAGVQTLSANPNALGQHTAVLLGGMTLAYRFLVNPTYKLFQDAKTYRAAPAVTPPTAEIVKPTAPQTPSEADF